MTMYKHILMATDLLDWNHQVENKVMEMQKLTGAKLSIMHVIEPLPAAYMAGDYGAIPGYRNIGEAWSNNVQDSLRKISDRIGVAGANLVNVMGNVRNEILQYVEQNDVDMIIVGSHGRHGLQLLLGSTANSILHQASCDVLAVRIKES